MLFWSNHMHRNQVFLGVLILVSFMTLWFVGKATNQLVHYFLLRQTVEARMLEWNIEQKSDNKFFIMGSFTFNYKGKDFQGKSQISDVYPNIWSAERRVKEISLKTHSTAWFNPHRPEKATLIKHFPFKPLLSACVLVGLSIYFFFLGRYVAKIRN